MIHTGHNGWFKISPIDDHFSVGVYLRDPIARLSFLEACKYTCKKLLERSTEYCLLISGGLDSEFVAKVLLEHKVPFYGLLLVHDGNLEESKYAVKFCNEHNINLRLIDYRNKSLELARELVRICHVYGFPSELSSIEILLSRHTSRDIITGGGSPEIYHTKEFGNNIMAYESDYYLNYYSPRHAGPFFSYTPELFLAHLVEYDYDADKKDQQQNKANFYGVINRPKMVQKIDVTKFGKILNKTYKDTANSVFNFGDKTSAISLLLGK